MKLNKTILALLGATTLTVCLSAADQPAQTTSAGAGTDPVVAKGTGFEIKRSQVEEAFDTTKAQAMAAKSQVPDDATLKPLVLDHLISNQLLLTQATDADKKNAQDKVEKTIADARKRFGTEELFNAQLKAMGKTLDQVKKELTENFVCQEVITRSLINTVIIPEAEVQKFYDENPDKFSQPEQVRAAHVLISIKDPTDKAPPAQQRDLPDDKKAEKRKLAEDVLKKAKAGEDFAKLAKDYSDDPGSKDKGGEYTFGRGQMMPTFEAAAFGQDVGKISELVNTPYGYHIIKTLEKIPARKTPLTEVSEKIRQFLQNKEAKQQIPAFLTKLRKEANVEVLDESLKPKPQALSLPPGMPPAKPAAPAATVAPATPAAPSAK